MGGGHYIERGSPWQYGFVDSFNSRFCDEGLNCENFATVQETRVVIAHWSQTYSLSVRLMALPPPLLLHCVPLQF